MNFFAFCLLVIGLVSRPIRETLALDTNKGLCRTFPIAHAKLGAVIVTEIEFREIAFQMGL